MFDRYESGEQAILVHIHFNRQDEEDEINEFKMLAQSAGAHCCHLLTANRHTPSAKYFVGEGKAQEIADNVKLCNADIIIFNHALTPAQERNLERLCECRVIDRTGLILDIFAQRARTYEGKLQVELAQLQHMSTRLIRGWTHLERQRGGLGLRGPGETQLESDRRLLRNRIKTILRRLEKVSKQREQGRQSRQKAEIPTISLVGYTNAGKSTLFNQLTSANVYAADQLFATLDPTLRRIDITDVGATIIADTVGFIRHLPHDLVHAFKATLQETQEADLLLHIIDGSDPRYLDYIDSVNEVLEELEVNDKPLLQVMNKIDLIPDRQPHIERDDQGVPMRVWVSSLEPLAEKNGLDLLLTALTERLSGVIIEKTLLLPVQHVGRFSGIFHQQAVILSENYQDDGQLLITIRMTNTDWNRLLKKETIELSRFII